MKENKFGALLTAFKDEDWSAYHKFSKSRYGEETDHQKVMDYIKKHKRRYDPKRMDNEYLRKKVRPNSKPIVFSNVISQLCKHIEAYFVWAEVMDDPMMEDTLLLKAYAKRGLTSQFHKQKKKSKINRDNQPLGLWKHYHEFMGEYLDYYKRMTTSVSGSKVVLEKCNNAIVSFSDELQGYLGVEMHNRNNLLDESWKSKYTELDMLAPYYGENNSSIFHQLKILNEKREWKTYYFLKDELYNRHLSKELAFTIISYLSSFLKWKNLHNDENAGQELVELYTYGLHKNILFPNGIIPLNNYALIITFGAKTGNYEWSENFIKSYSYLVSDKNTDQIKLYGRAHLSYVKGQFIDTINILRSIRFNDYSLEIKGKWLLLSSLYELNPNDTESFNYHITSLKSFVKRNKSKLDLAGSRAFMNSIKFLARLISNKNLLELESTIRKEKKMIHKKWFLEKIKGLQDESNNPKLI